MEELLKEWKNKLKLNDWTIELLEKSTLDCCGTTYALYNDYTCTIEIDSKMSDEEKEKALIHELLHLIHRDEYDTAVLELSETVSKLYTRFHERSIEKMAQTLYNIKYNLI